jgi:hypothetical protein
MEQCVFFWLTLYGLLHNNDSQEGDIRKFSGTVTLRDLVWTATRGRWEMRSGSKDLPSGVPSLGRTWELQIGKTVFVCK